MNVSCWLIFLTLHLFIHCTPILIWLGNVSNMFVEQTVKRGYINVEEVQLLSKYQNRHIQVTYKFEFLNEKLG